MAKGKGKKEAHITSGGIETNVTGFFGNITTESPFHATYGDHKEMGSEMMPVTASGRGSKEYFRGKILKASSSTGKGK